MRFIEKTKNTTVLTALLVFVYSVSRAFTAFAETPIEIPNQAYVHVYFPKEDFLGGPPSPSAMPPAQPTGIQDCYFELFKVAKTDSNEGGTYKLHVQLIDDQGKPRKRNIPTMKTDFNYQYEISLHKHNKHFYPFSTFIYPKNYKGGQGIGDSSNGFEPSYVAPIFNTCPPKYLFINGKYREYLYQGTVATIITQEKQDRDNAIKITIRKYTLVSSMKQADQIFREHNDIMSIVGWPESLDRKRH